MQKDLIEALNEFIPDDNPKKWAKLRSTTDSRRLQLMLLREILIELRKINANLRLNARANEKTKVGS